MNMYLINALLVLLVVRQIREHQLDARALAVLVLAVAAAAVLVLAVAAAAVCSCTRCPLAAATSRWTWRACRPARPWARSAAWPPGCGRAPTARPLGRAGVLAAGMWIAGVGARMVFYFAAPHGAGPTVAPAPGPLRWSWWPVADVLTRLAVVYLRGRRLTATSTPAIAAPAHAGASAWFRPGRGCHTALREVVNTWTGTTWFIEGDVADCFGSFDHQVMASILAEKIRDNRFLRLLRNMLAAGYLEDWRWNATLSGVPQGSLCSAEHKPPYAQYRIMRSAGP
jgi:hypothetical protein